MRGDNKESNKILETTGNVPQNRIESIIKSNGSSPFFDNVQK